MKTIKTSHILFSLALIAALALAAFPAAPAYALSASSVTAPAIAASQTSSFALAPNGILVCRTVIWWHNGHRILIRRCHRVARAA